MDPIKQFKGTSNQLMSWPIVAATVWCGAIGVGMWLLWNYAGTPGVAAPTASIWPTESAIELAKHEKTLVMFCHPRCPCSWASMAELAQIVAQCKDPVSPWIVFYKPKSAAPGWEQTDLWRSAAAIPGAHVMSDVDGAEARRFQAATSGQAFLYDPQGRLLFEGGVTSARGHEGDNAGESAIVDLMNGGASLCRSTPVFGCPIVDSTSSQ